MARDYENDQPHHSGALLRHGVGLAELHWLQQSRRSTAACVVQLSLPSLRVMTFPPF